MLKEPVGRQLQLQKDSYSIVNDFKQKQKTSKNNNNNSKNENLQVLPAHEIPPESMKSEKLKKSEQADEILGEDNNGLEKVRKHSFSFNLKNFA